MFRLVNTAFVQIMQVLSAPLIALTAYNLVAPGSLATSVVVGFSSGFASESILLMIRSLADELSPTTEKSQAISVRIDPPSVSLAPKQTKQFTAKVLGASNTEVAWRLDPPDAGLGTISQSGYYIAPDAQNEMTVTITAISAADRSRSASATVTVKPVPVK